jgi:hypothetical protein
MWTQDELGYLLSIDPGFDWNVIANDPVVPNQQFAGMEGQTTDFAPLPQLDPMYHTRYLQGLTDQQKAGELKNAAESGYNRFLYPVAPNPTGGERLDVSTTPEEFKWMPVFNQRPGQPFTGPSWATQTLQQMFPNVPEIAAGKQKQALQQTADTAPLDYSTVPQGVHPTTLFKDPRLEPAPPPAPEFDYGSPSQKGAWRKAIDIPKDQNGVSTPASIRYNNPGAAWPRARDELYGIEGYGKIGGNNEIGKFPTKVHGLAANMDLFATSKNYTGRTLEDATYTWRGNRPGNVPTGTLSDGTTFGPKTVITPELTKNPEFMKAIFNQYANHEAGKNNKFTDDEIDKAYKLYQAGGISGVGAAAPTAPTAVHQSQITSSYPAQNASKVGMNPMADNTFQIPRPRMAPTQPAPPQEGDAAAPYQGAEVPVGTTGDRPMPAQVARAAASQAPAAQEGNWTNYLADPANRAFMVGFGVQLMTGGWGNPLSQLGQALGNGAASVSDYNAIQQKQNDQEMKLGNEELDRQSRERIADKGAVSRADVAQMRTQAMLERTRINQGPKSQKEFDAYITAYNKHKTLEKNQQMITSKTDEQIEYEADQAGKHAQELHRSVVGGSGDAGKNNSGNLTGTSVQGGSATGDKTAPEGQKTGEKGKGPISFNQAIKSEELQKSLEDEGKRERIKQMYPAWTKDIDRWAKNRKDLEQHKKTDPTTGTPY